MARPKEYDESEVIAKAVELFQRQGYEATSVRDILDQTGLSSSSLYAAFGGKEELFLAALKAHAELEREAFHAQLTAQGGIHENLRGVFDGLVDLLVAEDHAASLTLKAAVEVATVMPPVFELLSEYIQELIKMLGDLLADAVDRGEVTLAHPAHDVAHFLLFSAYNLGLVAKVDNSRERLSRYAKIALSVVAGAAGGSPAPQLAGEAAR